MKNGTMYSSTIVKDVIRRYVKGASKRSIMQDLGIGWVTITNWLQKAGIQEREEYHPPNKRNWEEILKDLKDIKHLLHEQDKTNN